MDAARSAVRLGAKDVTIVYRRTRQEMPAQEIEVEEAIEEGVNIQFLTAPVSIKPAGAMLQLNCIRMALGEPDDSGRRRPVPVAGSEFTLTADTIISAIGQAVDGFCIGDEPLIDKRGAVKVDPATMQTSAALGLFRRRLHYRPRYRRGRHRRRQARRRRHRPARPQRTRRRLRRALHLQQGKLAGCTGRYVQGRPAAERREIPALPSQIAERII